jgi:hypothetical protein
VLLAFWKRFSMFLLEVMLDLDTIRKIGDLSR